MADKSNGQLGIELGGCGGGAHVRSIERKPQGSCHSDPVMDRARRTETRGHAISDDPLPIPYAEIDDERRA